jgi:hypothetical protein
VQRQYRPREQFFKSWRWDGRRRLRGGGRPSPPQTSRGHGLRPHGVHPAPAALRGTDAQRASARSLPRTAPSEGIWEGGAIAGPQHRPGERHPIEWAHALRQTHPSAPAQTRSNCATDCCASYPACPRWRGAVDHLGSGQREGCHLDVAAATGAAKYSAISSPSAAGSTRTQTGFFSKRPDRPRHSRIELVRVELAPSLRLRAILDDRTSACKLHQWSL